MSAVNVQPPKSGYHTDNGVHIYISVVSHGNENDIITTLRPHIWAETSKRITAVILSNYPSQRLTEYCYQHSIPLLENRQCMGFGANNNKIFQWLEHNYSIRPSDLFLCINPDVKVEIQSILDIAKVMEKENLPIAAPNLLDGKGNPDDNIRHYPRISDCFARLFKKSKASNIDKAQINGLTIVDWASGAFLCFRAGTYQQLGGFDERYFMYYEDADICRRAKKHCIHTYYLPVVTAIHFGARKSRKAFSRQFMHHIISALRFTLTD